MQSCFIGRDWSKIINRKSFSVVSIQRSEKLELREDTSRDKSGMWRLFAGTSTRTRIFLAQILPAQHKVDLSRSACVYLMWCLLCSSVYGSRKRKIPGQWVSVSMDESKGGFVSGGWDDPLTPQKTWEESQPLKRKKSLWLTVLSSLWGRCYWTLKARQMTQGCADSFRVVNHPEPHRENTFWVLSWRLSVFAMPASAKVKQGEFFWDKSWINYSTQTARVLSLAMCILKMPEIFFLLFLNLCVVCDLFFGGCQERW